MNTSTQLLRNPLRPLSLSKLLSPFSYLNNNLRRLWDNHVPYKFGHRFQVAVLASVLLVLLSACTKDTVPPSDQTPTARIPQALLSKCKAEPPPTGRELLQARQQFPVEKAYEAETKQWNAWLLTIEDTATRDALRAKLNEAFDWEARFLLMTNKFMAQTDNIGLCNQKLDYIEQHDRETNAVLEKSP